MLVAGVDEAGRGPLAGCVIAAAVILPLGHDLCGIRDSKKLSAKKRESLASEIIAHARAWAIGSASVEEIDAINILQASLLAMKRAVESLGMRPELVQVDGNRCPQLDCRVEAIVRGDDLIESISAASILAKVERDRQMDELHRQYPQYGFNHNRGYPTKVHLEALSEHGPCPLHRRTFAPVRRCLAAKTVDVAKTEDIVV